MVDIKLSPPREGVRGGREQFKWEDLKSHDLKDREHYLVGLLQRKNKFYKHDWYLKKDSETSDKDVDEIELTRRYEEEMMQEMLGVKPKRLMLLKSKPSDPRQLKELLDYNKDSKTTEQSDSKSSSDSNANLHKKTRSKSNTRTISLSRSRSSSVDSYRRRRRGYRDKDRGNSGKVNTSDNNKENKEYRHFRSDKYRKREEKYNRESDSKTYRSHKRSKGSRSRSRSRSHERTHHRRDRYSHHSSRYRD